MKVVQVIGSLQIGGAENQVVHLLNGLDSAKIEKFLVCFSDQDTANSRFVSPEVRRFTVRLERWGQLSCIFRSEEHTSELQSH